MNRDRFMKELEQLLMDLPVDERREAIQYYNDYFDDAGPENEAWVINELGSPEQVARTIREDLTEDGQYTEHGYEDARFRDRKEMSPDIQYTGTDLPSGGRRQPDPWKLVALLLLCLLLFPVIVPLFVVLLVVLIGILIGVIGLVIGAVVAAVALPFAGVILIGVAFYNLFFLPGVGIALGGIGCLLLSVGILTCLLAVWIIKALLPLCIRSIVSLIRYPLRKAGIVR